MRIHEDKQNLYQDVFDKMSFEYLEKQSQPMQERIKEGKEYNDLFYELAQDIFSSLYKNEPTLVPKPPRGTELNRRLLETFMEDKEFLVLKEYTTYDDFSSALASVSVMDSIIKELKENKDLQDKKGEDNNRNKSKQMQESLDKNRQNIRMSIRAGIKEANEKVKQADEVFANLGCGHERAEFKKLSFGDKMNILKEYEKVKNMAKFIGKYKAMLNSSRMAKITEKQNELCGITVGNNIATALPQELVQLRHGVLKYEFYRKMAEHQLLQYEMQHDEDMGRGPIVVALDDSGSMYSRMDMDATYAQVARGILVGLLECAKKEHRNFCAIMFSDSKDDAIKFEIPNGQATPQQMLDILSASLQGGTSYEYPLNWCLDKCTNDKAYDKGDIILITDGACSTGDKFNAKFNKERKDKDVKVQTIIVSNCLSPEWVTERAKEFSDTIYNGLGDEIVDTLYKSL